MKRPLPPAGTVAGVRRALAAIGLAFRASAGWVLALAAVALVMGIVPLASAWCMRVVMNGIAGPGGHRPALAFAAGGLATAAAVTATIPYLAQLADAELGRAVGRHVLDNVYRAVDRQRGLVRLEEPAFHDRLRLALQAGRSGPGQVVAGTLGMAQSLVMLVGFVATLTAVDPWLLAPAAGAALPAARVQVLLARRWVRTVTGLAPTERRQMFYQSLLSSMDAAKEIRLLGLGAHFRSRMLAELATVDRDTGAMDRRQARAQMGTALLATGAAAVGMVWVVLSGSRSVGDVSLGLAALAGTQAGMAGLVNQYCRAYQSMLLFDEYLGVMTTPPDVPEPALPVPAPRLGSGVELRDVWFRYAPDLPWVLRGVSFTVPAGGSVALVGLNGAGKSTVVKLLCRFYDPTEGTIRWDGVDLRDLAVDDLRSRIGTLFQDFMSYDLTAAENIGLGDLTAGRDRIAAAGALSGADATVRDLPAGYDTLLSRTFFDQADLADPRTGVALSGGQWQRVALARAYLRADRDLFVLDEPGAGLDPEAEYEVHRRLRRHRAGRATLLISHRLNTVRHADHIVVLEDGRVAEEGSHHELVRAGGRYARLFRLQAEGYREEDRMVMEQA